MRRIFRIICLLVLFAVCIPMQGQIVVKSFELLPNDLDASTYYPKKDFNNRTCAIIKVYTTQKDFSFDNGSLGIVDVVQKTAEIWVYVPENTIKLKIAHQQLGHLSNAQSDGYYWFSNRVKGGCCYRMDLETGTVRVEVKEAVIETGWLAFYSNPEGAEIYLVEDSGDEKHIGTTPFNKKMPYGKYTYRAKMLNYHDVMGLAVLDKDRLNINVTPKPAFGAVSVTSTPAGAKVYLNGKDSGKKTPCVLEGVPSGSNDIKLQLADYAPGFRTLEVKDGQTTDVNISLEARFAPVTINTLQGATIKVNGEVVGTNSYTANLIEGVYDIEASLASHETAKKQIEVVANMPQTIELKPTPIYGTLDVSSDPMDADIFINGKSYGITPKTIKNLLIGDYEITISKTGCATHIQKVSVTKENPASIDVKLQSGRTVSITTDKSGDEIDVDGNRVGVSPCSAELAFGTHEVKAMRGGKTVAKTINVPQGMGIVDVKLGFGEIVPNWSSSLTSSQRAVLERLVNNMVMVEGGTFTMGATAEQESDADSDEKPAHRVTLSDYYIGKYEVTQEEWQAVMGTNPSHFKGNNNPVEKVSWNDCQEFVKKLNQLTGLKFALPTEAQWEYAARGGNKSKGYKYSGSNNIGDVAWYNSNSGSKTHSVGTKAPNELGLYDMSGNVWEWCNDWKGAYSSSAQTNPTGPFSGSGRVLRGGSWYDDARGCRVSYRLNYFPSDRSYSSGFRVVLIP